jgi:histone H3/H4
MDLDFLKPIFETAVVIACHYSKACGRNTVTGDDMKMGMRFAARHVAGKELESLFPEIYDSEESDDSDLEVVDDSEEPFTRYEGDDERMLLVNAASDTWDEWVPETPFEELLKNACA